MNDMDLPESYIDSMQAILVNAVTQILDHEDFELHMSWCYKNIPNYLAAELGIPDDDNMMHAMSSCMGRAIWNATPLPGNNFRTKPLAKTGRNEKCPCGSGRKFKQCCSQFAQELDIDDTILWPILLDKLPRKVLNEAIKQHRLPIEALLHLADEYADQRKTTQAVNILEPLFQGEIKKPDEQYDYALNLLCNLYDDLGHIKKKRQLLNRIIDGQPRSPLRSGARQRLAAILMDEGDTEAAWNVFRLAHQDDPESYFLGVLEIQLLLSENKTEQAKQRADFWVRRLKRKGLPEDEPPLDFFIKVAKDPMRGMAEISMEVTDGMGERLGKWLESHTNRSIPVYQTNQEPSKIDEDRFESNIKEFGFTEQEIEESLQDIEFEEIEKILANPSQNDLFIDEDGEEHYPGGNFEDGLFLIPPDDIDAVEEEWCSVFLLDKPFSTNDESYDDIYDPWDSEEEEEWSSFLEAHPESFDSLEILDDLATALNTHAMAGTPWLDKQMLAPLLERAAIIIDKNLKQHPDPKLHWIFAQNRPALRSLARLIMHHLRNDEDNEAYQMMQQLIKLNPHDNHGFRNMLIDHLLQTGEDAMALSLANDYPNDMMVEIAFGRVLALYRLGREGDALTALKDANKMLPKVIRYLTHKRVRKPKLDPYAIKFGGDDQAWFYRDEMLETWQSTPGIIDWLKKAGKNI